MKMLLQRRYDGIGGRHGEVRDDISTGFGLECVFVVQEIREIFLAEYEGHVI
jgi:hypothetical protein